MQRAEEEGGRSVVQSFSPLYTHRIASHRIAPLMSAASPHL